VALDVHDGGAHPSHTPRWPALGENDGSVLCWVVEFTCRAFPTTPCPRDILAGKDALEDRGDLGGNDALEDGCVTMLFEHRLVGELEQTRCRTGVDVLLLLGLPTNCRYAWLVPK
jgi:hypothetical protein